MITAEARRYRSLAWTSRWISYLAVLIVFSLAVAEYLNVGWQDTRLPSTWFQYTGRQNYSTVLSVLAAQGYTSHALPGLIVGCLIYTTVSTSSTVLYVASRALHGTLRTVPPPAPPLERLAKWASFTRRDGTPHRGIIISVISFWWLPFTTLASGDSVRSVSHITCSRFTSRSHGNPY